MPEGEGGTKVQGPPTWAEHLRRLNAEWHENCDTEGFRPDGPVVAQIGTVEALLFVGEETTFPVRIKGVCGLAAAKLGVQLDRHVAELVRVEPMSFLEGDPPVSLEFAGLRPGERNHQVAITRPPGMPGVHGIGTLVRLVVRARNPGVTTIRLVRPQLFNAEGESLEVRSVPLRLTVMDAAARGGRPYGNRRPRPGAPQR